MYYKDYAEGRIIMKQIPNQINVLYETKLNQKSNPKKIMLLLQKMVTVLFGFLP